MSSGGRGVVVLAFESRVGFCVESSVLELWHLICGCGREFVCWF